MGACCPCPCLWPASKRDFVVLARWHSSARRFEHLRAYAAEQDDIFIRKHGLETFLDHMRHEAAHLPVKKIRR